MDAVIRSPRLASERTRLRSETAAPADATAGRADPNQAEEALRARLRAEIEAQLRAEMTGQLEKMYAREFSRARADGLAAAEEEAKASAAAEVARARAELEERTAKALEAFSNAHREALSRWERDVGEVSFAALCRMLGEPLGRKLALAGVVERACAAARADASLVVKLSPVDVETLKSAIASRDVRLGLQALSVEEDDSLPPGSCVVKAASGEYHAAIEAQLSRLRATLCASREAAADAGDASPVKRAEG